MKSTSIIPIDISIDPIIKIGDLVFVKLSSGTGHLFWPALIESIQSKRTKKQSFTIVYFDSPTIPFEKKKGDLLQDDSKIYRSQINQTFVDHAYELVLNKKAYRSNTYLNIWSDIQLYYLTHSKSKEAARIQDCIDCIKHPRRHTKRVPKANVSVDNEDNKDEDLRMTSPQVHKEPAVLSTRNAIVCKKQKIPTKKREIDEIPLLSVPFEENESIDKPASKKRKMEPPIPPPPVIFTLQPSILQQIPESIKRNVLSYYSSKLSAIYNS